VDENYRPRSWPPSSKEIIRQHDDKNCDEE
jgi:hypothetical protein